MSKRDGQIEYAKRIFVHYLRTLAEYAGMSWDGDNTAEVEEAVEQLIQGIVHVTLEQTQD